MSSTEVPGAEATADGSAQPTSTETQAPPPSNEPAPPAETQIPPAAAPIAAPPLDGQVPMPMDMPAGLPADVAMPGMPPMDPTAMPGMAPIMATPAPGISADEMALYDRQIRLWGVDAQERLRSANVCLITMKGLGGETAKNLVLAGIGALTIVDDAVVTADDLGAQFLFREEHVGVSAALPELQRLNPRVDIMVGALPSLLGDPTIFGAYNLIIATDMSLGDQQMINAACRMQGRPFYAASTVGMYGYIFADLVSHDFVISRQKGNVPTKIGPETATRSIVAATTSKDGDKVTELVTKREVYTPIQIANTSPLPAWYLSNKRRMLTVTPILSCLRALWDYQTQTGQPMPSQTSRDDLALFTTLATNKHKELQLPPETLRSEVLRQFLTNLGAELSPVCAFLGGRLAQDAINVIGGKEQPIQNLLVFDGEEAKAHIYAFSSEIFTAMPPAAPPIAGGIPLPVMGNGVPLVDPMAGGPMGAPMGVPGAEPVVPMNGNPM